MKERVKRQTIAPRLFSKPKDVKFLLGLLVVGCADFIKLIFSKKSSETWCQTVLIQIRTDVLLVLISVQNVCKGYMQMTSHCYCPASQE